MFSDQQFQVRCLKIAIWILVEFNRNGYQGAFEQYMGFKQHLEEIYQRPVDLVTIKKFRNPIFQKEVDSSKILIYAA